MESTIYQESPLAEYLEGQGEAIHDWPTTERDLNSESFDRPSFAPRGPPITPRSRVQRLLSPLRIQGHRRTRTLTALQDVCSAAARVRVPTSENDRFIDQFRYSIIASQLLVPEAKASIEAKPSNPLGDEDTLQYHAEDSFSLQGAAVSAAISFFPALMLHWTRARSSRSAIRWLNACITLVLVVIVACGIHEYARRKATQRVRQSTMRTLSDLITRSHGLNSVARSALGLIQEVEVVSRGYEISNPLPPLSRLEVKGSDRRCLDLRNGLASFISSTIRRYLDAHTALLPFVDVSDMRRYHDIYDLPQQDYQDMIQGLPSALDDDPGSSKGLKTSLMRLFVARKILLCSLLALPSMSSIPDLKRWAVISDEIASVSSAVEISTTSLSRQIHEVSNRHWGDRRSSQGSARPDGSEASELVVPETPGKEKVQAQLRRLNALSQSIRGLNARLLLMRDEADRMIGDAGRSACLSSVLATQYDLIGVDLRNLITEWERGKNTMLLSVGSADPSSLSRSSSGLRSPQSPVQSLGGITAVNEGSPAEALKRLVGEGSQPPSNDGLGSDEDIFEAVSLPKPKCVSTTREEKLAKMQRDRQKRATLQENRDATTSMLRELETVIKHRPRGRTTSRITGV